MWRSTIRGVAIIGLSSLLGCQSGVTQVRGLAPVWPAASVTPATVASLQPTLEWSAGGHGATYDLVVYPMPVAGTAKPHVEVNGEVLANTMWSRAKMGDAAAVYVREGLTSPRHRVDPPLQAGVLYGWAARVGRTEQRAPGEWSTVDGYWNAQRSPPNPMRLGAGVVLLPVTTFGWVSSGFAEAVSPTKVIYGESGKASESYKLSRYPLTFRTPAH